MHKGRSPLYLEYFTGEKKVEILVDQLQSEQGARFYQKRNRNIIVEVDENEELPVYENFVWASLGQIKELLTYPNVVNMDTVLLFPVYNMVIIVKKICSYFPSFVWILTWDILILFFILY